MADTAEIRSLIQPPLDRSLRDRMREVFTSAAFDVPPEAGREERCRRAYEQLRIVNSEFGPGTDLLADPARLFELDRRRSPSRQRCLAGGAARDRTAQVPRTRPAGAPGGGRSAS
jgi:hypothetical protein